MKTLNPSTPHPAAVAEGFLHASIAEARGAFPRADCNKIVVQAGAEFESLTSDLDTYFYDIWSPSNGVRKLSQKSEAWLLELKEDLGKSFFVRYPQYVPLEAMINSGETPDLYRRLALFDKMRENLLLILSELLAQHEYAERNGALMSVGRSNTMLDEPQCPDTDSGSALQLCLLDDKVIAHINTYALASLLWDFWRLAAKCSRGDEISLENEGVLSGIQECSSLNYCEITLTGEVPVMGRLHNPVAEFLHRESRVDLFVNRLQAERGYQSLQRLGSTEAGERVDQVELFGRLIFRLVAG